MKELDSYLEISGNKKKVRALIGEAQVNKFYIKIWNDIIFTKFHAFQATVFPLFQGRLIKQMLEE